MEKFNLFGIKKDSKIHNSKKKGFSIAYAIVALVVVAIAVAGLTPVLTRKLPNLSTSSIIKNPKGWYESFNAPKEGASYCKKCMEYDDCLANNKEHPERCTNKPTKEDWDHKNDIQVIKDDKDPCYGNPACIPYIKPPEKEGEPNPLIIAFEQYCKSNGKCGPGPREKECGLKNKPCPCDGECKFKPAKGVTKYEVFAIGGGGAAGSAVAANPYLPGYGETYRDSVTGKAKYENDLPIGANIRVDNLNIPDGEKINANFIDTNKKYTQSHTNKIALPNMADISDKCASNIFYTIDAEPNEHDEAFHTYPTEDNNAKLAIISSKQVARILKEKHKYNPNPQYRIGNRIVDYKNRYYLYTKYLGAYSYNQNPEYESMPEWLNVDGKEARYRDGLFEDDIYNSALNSKSYVYRSGDNCKNYVGKGECKIGKNGLAIKTKDIGGPILSKYSDAAAIACSGDAGKGQAITYHNTKTMCPWMIAGIKYCPKDKVTYETKINDLHGKTIYDDETCGGTFGKLDPPECFDYREIGDWECKGTYHPKTDKCSGKWRLPVTCHYLIHVYNRQCWYLPVIAPYARCECENPVTIPDRCKNNKDTNKLCYPRFSYFYYSSASNQSDRNFVKEQGDSNSNSKGDMSGTGYDIKDIDGVPTGGAASTNDDIDDDNNDYSGETESGSESSGDWVPYQSSGDSGFNETARNGSSLLKQADRNPDKIYRLKIRGGGTPKCNRINDYTLHADGGAGGKGICVYVNKKIEQLIENGEQVILSAESNVEPGELNNNKSTSAVHRNSTLNSHDGATCAAEGWYSKEATACIKHKHKKYDSGSNCCRTAHGAEMGHPGCVDPCAEGHKGIDGAAGSSAGGSGCGDGGNFATSAMLNIQNAQKGQGASGYEVDNSSYIVNGNMQGVLRAPGRYNYRYVWYMPFVTKHLMFGLAGEGGEEVHTLITLTENQSLSVKPGAGALKTVYTSGKNGGNGENSTVKNDDAKINLIAHGGKGGLGSQKTDEYVLCHKSDAQKDSADYPCYYENPIKNNFKKTHIFKDGKFLGIQATQPKMSTLVQSIKMSVNLKKGTPGIGAMGYGTESVSDFVCEKRHVDKWDEIYGKPVMTKADVLYSDNTNQELCKGNSKIKYIIPNGAAYSSGTGAVIILW